jgi:hypothetical protein
MHPRTLVILLVLVFALAFGLRWLVTAYSLLPVSEEAVLKRAVAVTVSYNMGGQRKTLTIDEPDELRDLLRTMRFQREQWEGYTRHGMPPQQTIDFRFPNGRSRHCNLEGPQPYQLSGFVVDKAFYDKLCEIVSRHEGRPVDVLDFHPVAVPAPQE